MFVVAGAWLRVKVAEAAWSGVGSTPLKKPSVQISAFPTWFGCSQLVLILSIARNTSITQLGEQAAGQTGSPCSQSFSISFLWLQLMDPAVQNKYCSCNYLLPVRSTGSTGLGELWWQPEQSNGCVMNRHCHFLNGSPHWKYWCGCWASLAKSMQFVVPASCIYSILLIYSFQHHEWCISSCSFIDRRKDSIWQQFQENLQVVQDAVELLTTLSWHMVI